jgi:drug/metabolite transporter (DMT)-like permease
MKTNAVRAWAPLLALAALSLIWGATWVVAKEALAYAPPFALAAQRCVGAALSLVLVMKLSGRRMRLVAPGQTLAISLTQVVGFMVFQTWALVESGPGKTAVLIFTMPIWTLLLARLVLGERIRGMQWLAALSTLAGLVLVIAPWSIQASPLGKGLGVAAALCWGVGTVLVKRLRATHDTDLLALTTWQMLLGTVPLLVLAAAIPEAPTQWSASYAGILLFMSLGSTALGWWLWIYILDRVPAWEASLSVLGTPVVAIVSSSLLLGEQFRVREVAGMALIGAGLALLSFFGWLAARRREALAA